jgi:predicted CoA-binding protein
MTPAEHHVAVLGATPKPGRYANQAVQLLKTKGYRTIPVHPRFTEIEGLPVANSLASVEQPVHTLTLYVGPDRLQPMINEIISLKPGRVIFNPGTESRELQQALSKASIEWFEACTLVMLKTDTF